MKVGELYEIRHKWLLPHSTREFWSTCGPVLYLGKDMIETDDGRTVVNHTVLVKGERRTLDWTFLKFLEPLTKA